MNRIIVSLVVLFSVAVQGKNNGMYYQELKKLKKAPETQMIFDEDSHSMLREIERDLILYKNLTPFQRFIRSAFLALDVIIVTPHTMPYLYTYVDEICAKAQIKSPTIFITRQEGFFNAAAQKFFASSGAIVIGQKLLQELSDDALEAVIAHEVGHIKYNHVNKCLALSIPTLALYGAVLMYLWPKVIAEEDSWIKKILFATVLNDIIFLIPSLIINKRFEREADEFAYKYNGKAQGLIEFFELVLKKDEMRKLEFLAVESNLKNNKDNLIARDYYELLFRYYVAKCGHRFTEWYKDMYYNSFIGAHPSPQDRIAAAIEYL